MYSAAKRKGAGEASSDIEDQPARPTLKRRRTSDTGDSATQNGPPSRSSSGELLEGNIERTIEQDEQQTTPVGMAVKAEDVKVKDETPEEPSTSQASSITKKEQSFSLKRENTGSSDVQDPIEEPTEPPCSDRHWRRSAAPSPYPSAQGAQRRLIRPQDIPSVLLDVRRPSADNPGRCPCGWYEFYAVCGHVSRSEPYKCGARRARSGAAVFCSSPAPRHNIDDYIVNQPCQHCVDPGPIVLLGP